MKIGGTLMGNIRKKLPHFYGNWMLNEKGVCMRELNLINFPD